MVVAVAVPQSNAAAINANRPTSGLVWLSVVYASIGGFLFGYDQGVMSGIIVMPHWVSYFNNPDPALTGLIVSLYLLGAMVGALIAGPLSERIGRKRSIMLGCVVFTFGSALQCGATNLNLLLAGRWFQGMGIGTFSMNVPVYQSELAPPLWRGRIVALQQLSIVAGIMCAFWIGYGCSFIDSDASWRVPLGLQIVPAIILFFGGFILPYSPRWLVDKGRDAEGKLQFNLPLQVLARLHAKGDANDEFVQIEYREITEQAAYEREHCVRTYGELFKKGANRRRAILAIGIQVMQQWTGINAVLYYAPLIFQGAGLSSTSSSLLATGLNGVISVLSTIPAVLYIDRWGRVKTLIFGAIGMSVTMLLAGALLGKYPYMPNGGNNLAAQYVAIIMMYLFTICFSISWGPCGWIYPAEIFPLRLRAKGTGLSTSANYLMNFVIGEITPVMLKNVTYGTYLLFFATNAVCAALCYFFYPETKGRSLEEMEILFGGDGAEAIARADMAASGNAAPLEEKSTANDVQQDKTETV
ncbi:hypothetical protein BZG36_00080 [Bifiguratus adelaidae]|uniref:Major facilitator superfamily (MFS) profile domain-containing protein n=1 Tax=Bifiguratus adelaidae TaxID=1938954 RepID=A0A261Y8G4_9FUNG|nr:hypothetical protein BZG36_00080 [Bifiguratus adelaidae]